MNQLLKDKLAEVQGLVSTAETTFETAKNALAAAKDAVNEIVGYVTIAAILKVKGIAYDPANKPALLEPLQALGYTEARGIINEILTAVGQPEKLADLNAVIAEHGEAGFWAEVEAMLNN